MRTVRHRGWELLRLASEQVEVDVLPGKGGDIVAVRWVPTGLNVLWETPWGLREKGAIATAGTSAAMFIENYEGGWQTLFPNGGDSVVEQGVELGFHGEAAAAPWDWARDGDETVLLHTTLVRSPFQLSRRVAVRGTEVTVAEEFTNTSPIAQEAMWSHHPAFGAPFLDGSCRLETGATSYLADAGRRTASTDLEPGGRSPWPDAAKLGGGTVDLREVPAPDAGIDRMGYLTDFTEGWYSLTNPGLGLTATVSWDKAVFPHAWYWCEAAGTAGFPWHQRAYVLAVEPATSHPAAGLAAARATGTAVSFGPLETRRAEVRLRLSAV